MGILTVLIKPKEEENVTFALVLFALPPGMSAKTILDTRVNAISGMVKNFKKLEEGQIQIAGRTVPRVVFQQSAKDQLILVNVELSVGGRYQWVSICVYYSEGSLCRIKNESSKNSRKF